MRNLTSIVVQREEELAATRDALLALERRVDSEQTRYHERLATLVAEQARADDALRVLRAQLDAAPTRVAFDALRRQVEMFRELGYDVDGVADRATSSSVSSLSSSSTTAAAESGVAALLRDQLRQRDAAAASLAVARADAERRAGELSTRVRLPLINRFVVAHRSNSCKQRSTSATRR